MCSVAMLKRPRTTTVYISNYYYCEIEEYKNSCERCLMPQFLRKLTLCTRTIICRRDWDVYVG